MKPMTKQRIGQYNSLKREIAMLEDQIYNAESGGDYVTDVVRGSTKNPPYSMHNIVIKGYGSRSVPKLSERKARCIAECDAIEQYIDSVEDSVVRQLLAQRYIEGRNLAEAAELVGYSESQIKRILKRFFENDALK